MNHGKLVLGLAAGLLVLAMAVAAGYAALPQPPGQIELSASEFDFGAVLNTNPVSQTFWVRNADDGPLQLSGVSTSCGCTTAEVTSRELAPGETTDLTVTFDPDFHVTEGEVVRLVWFATNDPTQPWAEVRITADVQ